MKYQETLHAEEITCWASSVNIIIGYSNNLDNSRRMTKTRFDIEWNQSFEVVMQSIYQYLVI